MKPAFRYIAAMAFLGALHAAPAARADQALINMRVDDDLVANGAVEWRFRRFGGGQQDSQALLRAQLEQAFSMQRLPGMDDWAWRDAVEDQLVEMGSRAIPLFFFELHRRQGFEADALRVAIFRLEHQGVELRTPLRAWAEKAFPSATVKIARIMGQRAILPHHLFYALEIAAPNSQSRQRQVVALAADGKVHPLPDDAALARFLSIEFPPTATEAAREHAAELVALLALSREVHAYAPDITAGAAPLQATAQAMSRGARMRASVAFDKAGRIATLTTTRDGSAPSPGPVPLPSTPAPPPMPD
jgi:hypothetical protein